ncbi:MAG: YceI family protein [Roseovarius sp.]
MPRLLPLLLMIATLATAAPALFRLEPERSVVEFVYTLGQNTSSGRIPIRSADLLIDLDRLAASRIEVVLDARGARAGFFLATDAIRGPGILDAAHHPEIRFRSTDIRGTPRAATVAGELTMRGVTRPITLEARLYRQPDTDIHDRNNLTVLLTGSLSRAAFGATGYADLVGDRVDIRIIAYITR